MKLYFLIPNSEENTDLFVWAERPSQALAYWIDYNGGDLGADATKVRVVEVPTRGMVGAVPWDVLKQHTLPVNLT